MNIDGEIITMTKKKSNKLAGKVAIVTGAGQGIGKAIARLFANEGAAVVINSRTASHVQQVVDEIIAAGGEAEGFVADIGLAEAVTGLINAAIKRFKRVDILVHNAGIFPFSMLEDISDETWNEVLNVNLSSGFRLARACIPSMKAAGGGRILYTSSVTGNRVSVPGCAHYAASKGGINGLIKTAALELAAYNITVNGVEPGLILTPGAMNAASEEQREMMASYVPLKRWGLPQDIAYAMLYLASDESAYVTGQTIIVDGGAVLPENGAIMQ
jgi:3-oxoacyl-[acyl-carrier protein] reductase